MDRTSAGNETMSVPESNDLSDARLAQMHLPSAEIEIAIFTIPK